MLQQLADADWYEELENHYPVRVVRKNFKYLETYSLVLELESAGFLNVEAIWDKDFKKKLLNWKRKYYAMRIIREFPLPFKAAAFWDVPAAANAMCKYLFAKTNHAPVLEPKEEAVIRSEAFQRKIQAAIENNNGEFVGIRVERIRAQFSIGYLELKIKYQRNFELGVMDRIDKALHKVMAKYFDGRLYLKEHGEEDVT